MEMEVEKEIDFFVNDYFYDFIDDWSSRIYFLVGGYGSSKSYHIAVKLIKKLLQEKRKALIVREVFDTIRDSCFDLLVEVAEAMGVDRYLTFTTSPMQVRFQNGSKIIFKGMDKPAKLKSLNGVSIVWIEECSEVKYTGFKEILGRLRHPVLSNHLLLSTNPVSKTNWCYTYFFQDKQKQTITLNDEELYQKRIIRCHDTYYHHSTVEDNFFAPKGYIHQLDELQMHDPDLYRIARRGRFGVNGRLVFPQFEVQPYETVLHAMRMVKHPIEKNGMDFGFVTSFNAVVRMLIDPDQKILYLYEEYYSRDKTDPEIAEEIAKWKNILIKADCAEAKAIRYYRQQGFRMRACHKFKGSRAVYTKKVKRFRRIICADTCKAIIQELQDLTFAEDKNGALIEDEFCIDPHTLSAIWYGLDDYEVSDLKGGGMRVLKEKEAKENNDAERNGNVN